MGLFDDLQSPGQGKTTGLFDDLKSAKPANKEVWQKVAETGPLGRFVAGADRGIADVVHTVLDRPAKFLADTFERPNPSTGEAPSARMDRTRDEARRAYDAELGGSNMAKLGKIGGEILVTLPVGGALAAPVRAAQVASARLGATALPKLLNPLALSLETGGLRSGTIPKTLAQGAGDLGLRATAGGLGGYASAEMVTPGSGGLGATIGAAVPVAGKALSATGNAIANTVKPFTASGQRELAQGLVKGAAQDPGAFQAVMRGPTQGIGPLSLAEVANDPGISSLTRTLAGQHKPFRDLLTSLEHEQNAARFGFLDNLAGNEQTIKGLADARKAATDPLLARAQAVAKPVETSLLTGYLSTFRGSPMGQRRAVSGAMDRAMQPFTAPGGTLSAVPFNQAWGARQNLDDISRGIGEGLDDRIAKASGQSLGELRSRLNTALENASPPFADYSKEYARRSAPIDAARTLQDLAGRASANTVDMAGNPMLSGPKLRQALKGVDEREWAKLSDPQKSSLMRLVDELDAASRAKSLGFGGGVAPSQSPFASAAVKGQLPFLARHVVSSSDKSGALNGLLGIMAGGARDKILGQTGQMLLDAPYAAASLFPKTAPLTLSEMRKMAAMEAMKKGGGLLGMRAATVGPVGLLQRQE